MIIRGPLIIVLIKSLCSTCFYTLVKRYEQHNIFLFIYLCQIVSLLLRKDMKVVLTLLVVNGTFVLCWLPHFIGITCLTFTNGLCPFHDNFFTITTMLAMLNSGCNPFIYTLTYRKFRKAFKKVFPWLRSSRTGNINSSAD